MNEEFTPKSSFESEMTRMMNLVIIKIEGLETSVSGLETSVSGLETSVSGLETSVSGLETSVSGLETSVSRLEKEVAKNSKKLDILAGQFNDVGVMAIEDNKRITKLEGEVAELQIRIH